MTRSWWLAVVESYPCPVCMSGPGDRCVTASGNTKSEPHAERTRQGDRCPRCGSQLNAATTTPLCDHCQLVRDMETERATTWKRRT